jgi:hypothetical protein
MSYETHKLDRGLIFFCWTEFCTVSSEWIFYIFYVLSFSAVLFMHI